jgi:hypothetical protein
MANFNINILQQKGSDYTVVTRHIFQREDCDILNDTQPIGLIETTNNPSLIYLLLGYTNPSFPWQTVTIRNLQYTDQANFYLRENAAQIPPGAGLYTIDVTGQAGSQQIGDFEVVMDGLDLTIQDPSILFEVAITDTNNTIGDYFPVSITIQINECSEKVPFEDLIIGLPIETQCSSTQTVEVQVPAEESRRVVITPSDGFGNPVIDENISGGSTLYNLSVLGDNNGALITTSSVTLDVFIDGVNSPIATHTLSREHIGTLC